MAEFVAKIDMSDVDGIIEYVAHATCEWPDQKREQLRVELLAALEDAIDLLAEKEGFAAVAGPGIFAVLNRHGLNPVC